MSFLNSVLSSIGAERSRPAGPQSSQPVSPQVAPGPNSTSSNLKRKAEAFVDPNTYKAPRKENTIPPNSTNQRPPIVNRTLPAGQVRANSQDFLQKSQSLPLKQTKPTASIAQPAITKDVPTGNSTSKLPPKNSYREILARAQAVKAAQAHVGQIKHKPVVKVSKKERLAQEAEAARQSKLAKNKKHKSGAQSKTSNGQVKGPEGAILKEKKKPLDLGYKGTMRSNAPASSVKGTQVSGETSRPGIKASTQRDDGRSLVGGRYRYASYSDEEDDEEDEYESDVSDDMEAAGFDELEEEEEASLKYARKEDLLALREENEHKREKEERRKKLQQLAAARRR